MYIHTWVCIYLYTERIHGIHVARHIARARTHLVRYFKMLESPPHTSAIDSGSSKARSLRRHCKRRLISCFDCMGNSEVYWWPLVISCFLVDFFVRRRRSSRIRTRRHGWRCLSMRRRPCSMGLPAIACYSMLFLWSWSWSRSEHIQQQLSIEAAVLRCSLRKEG